MNIWEQVKSMPNADYYDQHTGNTYLISEYTRCKKFGLPTVGIRVQDFNGNIIGVIPEDDPLNTNK